MFSVGIKGVMISCSICLEVIALREIQAGRLHGTFTEFLRQCSEGR